MFQTTEPSSLTEHQLRALLVELFDPSADELTLDDDPAESFGIDSLTRLHMLALVEERFDLRLRDEEITGLTTLGDIVRRIDAERARPLQ